MGMKIQTPEQYEASLRKLFPRGTFWDRQFADPGSDCSLFCKTKIDAFIRFRKRMSDLFDESILSTAGETLDDWERVITGSIRRGLEPEERKALLLPYKNSSLNNTVIKEIGCLYGIGITDIVFPFRPAFFGFSRFGTVRAAGPAAYSMLYIHAMPLDSIGNNINWELFRTHLETGVLANYIIFIFGGQNAGSLS
jgi:hypothetical protein